MSAQLPATTLETVATDARDQPRDRGSFRNNPALGYYSRRFGLYLITLWGSLSATFLFFRFLPGDPISGIIAQLQTRGQYSSIDQSEAMVEHYRREFGLDGSMWEQYQRYFQRMLLDFDFGPSVLSYPTPATDLIVRAIPWTVGLIGVATLLGWLIGVLAGTLVAWKRDTRIAEWITNVCLVLSHIPAYFVALVLIIFLAYRFDLLPANGAYDATLKPSWSLDFVFSVIKYGTLPVLATVIGAVANWLIGTRALVVSILGEDFLTYANAKGLSPRRILTSYVLRNAWLPQIAALGLAMGSVVSGNVLIERLFRYPGVGNLLVDSVVIK
ncbi:MAG: ABC transporter permease, partial [Chloroflexia bacterium]|nr:ABC transporter permease [Chloroflexia bacterium]